MTYTIVQKTQQAIPDCFGGGVRFRFQLAILYPNGSPRRTHTENGIVESTDAPTRDNITSDLTVDEGVFVMFEIGDRIHLNTVTAHE